MNHQLEKAWQDYYSFEAKAAGKHSATCGFPFILRDLLTATGTLMPSSRLIDIGCGTGRISLPLSEVCYLVRGIDANEDCISAANGRIGNKTNISFKQCTWEELKVTVPPKYDLVLACMCPFVRGSNDIQKLTSLSNSKCAIVTVRPGSSNPLMSKVLRGLPIKPNEGIVLQEQAIVELLEQTGYPHSVERFAISDDATLPIEEFIQREALHMRALGVDDAISIPVLETCAAEHAQGSMIEVESTTLFSLITWNITKK